MKTFKISASLPSKFTSRSDYAMQTAKNSKATTQTLQALVSVLDVKVNNSAISKTQNKYNLFVMVARRKPFLYQKNMAVQLRVYKGIMFGKNQTQHISTNTSHQLSSMGEEE